MKSYREKMCERIYLIAMLATVMTATSAQKREGYSREQYIDTYAELAMIEMGRAGIPASITLAQGCLESNNGNSTLAVNANNHFGIKCHDWNGKRIYHDDDEKDECFRHYKNVYDSYLDHTHFLTSKSRYEFLFDLRPDDYKQWAKGLKKAGYATSSTYADMLIKIIEENELYKYDQLVMAGGEPFSIDKDSKEVIGEREILTRNRIEYIIAVEGDTPESLREELDLYKNELYKYNNLEEGAKLQPGQILYLQPKRRKADQGYEIHIVMEGETMYDISQMYGVKIKQLYAKNQMYEGQYLEEGTEIFLRKKRRSPILKIEPLEEEPEEEMIFKFENQF